MVLDVKSFLPGLCNRLLGVEKDSTAYSRLRDLLRARFRDDQEVRDLMATEERRRRTRPKPKPPGHPSKPRSTNETEEVF